MTIATLISQCNSLGYYERIGYSWTDDCERSESDHQYLTWDWSSYKAKTGAATEEIGFNYEAAAIGASVGALAAIAAIAAFKACKRSKSDDSFERVNEPLL